MALCDLPTPVDRLERLGAALNLPRLYVKRDGLTAALFGGNKVRALEFLFGQAKARRVKRVAAIGLAGTSMALATTLYARQLSIPCTALLASATCTEEARRNLRYFHLVGGDIQPITLNPLVPLGLLLHWWRMDGALPMFFNASGPTGITGYVNAGFELALQVKQGLLPEPSRIYIALGLQGTAVGLLLGVRAAGLKSQVVCVASHIANAEHTKAGLLKRFRKANTYLRRHDTNFPLIGLTPADIEIRNEPAPALDRPQVRTVWDAEHIDLDATWTAPTYAAMLRDIKAEKLHDETLVFWHTYNSRPYPSAVDDVDYRSLPRSFQAYFTAPVQEINAPSMIGSRTSSRT